MELAVARLVVLQRLVREWQSSSGGGGVLSVLFSLTPLLDPCKPIHLGLRPPGEGVPAFPLISELNV